MYIENVGQQDKHSDHAHRKPLAAIIIIFGDLTQYNSQY